MPCKKDRIADNCFSTSSGMEILLWIYHDLPFKKMGRSKFMAFLVAIISGPQYRTQRCRAPVLQSRPTGAEIALGPDVFVEKSGERSTRGIQN
jgi:hypothetical protein